MTYLIIGVLALLATVGALRALRGKWDLLAEHSRDLMRHLLAAILMAGTMAGTIWTFSAGRLTLSGALERLVSVGGIALALEAGVIYCGWFLGQLDTRIATARKDRMPELLARRKTVNLWFYITAAISAIANLIFRSQQLNNFLLAAFVSAAPVVLIVLLLIKLRPLPIDYTEKARQATQRALFKMVQQAEHTVLDAMRYTRSGGQITAERRESLLMATSILSSYASTAESQALDYGLMPQSGAEATQLYIDTAQLQISYGIPARTAQDWVSKCPGARPRRDGRPGKEAPLSAIQRAHGLPAVGSMALPEPRQTRSGRRAARDDADGAQSGLEVPQIVLADTQAVTVSTQPVTSGVTSA